MTGLSNATTPTYRPSSTFSNAALRRRVQRQTRRIEQLSKQLDRSNQRSQQLKDQLTQQSDQLAWANTQLASKHVEPNVLARWQEERPMPGHQYGVRLIALCIELAKRVGFHAAEFVIQSVFNALGIDSKVPSHDAIEQWTLRLGVAELNDDAFKDQPMIWMSDHSSQIGKEKVLLIIGLPLKSLPPPGQSLDLANVHVLAVVPGENWKKEDVEREYRKLASRIGEPVYLLSDGAVELREPAQSLVKDGQNTIVLGDLKHHAANLLEKEIGRSERFKTFQSQVGLTRNRVQQTELSHFAPPPLKQKSRFMNLASLFRWSQMVLLHLEDPESPSRKGISAERMEEKFGWLREYAQEISSWGECQEVIDVALFVINTEGLSKDSLGKLEQSLGQWLEHAESSGDQSARPADSLAQGLHRFVSESVDRLRSDWPRAWLSTEILESLFGRFKQVERQHSRGGFTRLIAAIPVLCRRVDASLIRIRFETTKANDVKTWLKATLGTSLTSRRNAAYLHYAHNLKNPLPIQD
jgi:hypothetical protein